MKWNGIVSQLSHSSMASRFATANAPHARSTRLGRGNAISDVTDGTDRRRAELLPQPADADVDDLGARGEVVAPDRLEHLLSTDDLIRVTGEMVQDPELMVGQRDGLVAHARPATRHVELEHADV